MRWATVAIAIAVLLFFVGRGLGSDGRIQLGYNGFKWNRDLNPGYSLQEEEIEKRRVREICKLYFIRGIYEGYAVGAAMGAADDKGKADKIAELYYTDASYADLADKVDGFYQDIRNRKIPVAQALLIISMEMRGQSKEAIERMLNEFRK